jgi:transposase
MIAVPAGMRVLVATRPIDFRKGADGLVALVSETLGDDPFLCVGRDYVAARSIGAQFGGNADLCRHIIFRSVPAAAAPYPWV